MIKRRRMCEAYLATLIENSYATTARKWSSCKNINCYAFARRLTYPDRHQEFYTPGMIYRLKFGTGDVVHDQIDPNFISNCVMRDSIALNQSCTQVNFAEIDENDGRYYFGLVKFHICPSKITNPTLHHYLKDVDDELSTTCQWHFICRTPAGIWLHKPNWFQDVEEIEWEIYGKVFNFLDYNGAFGGLYVPTKGITFDAFFYRVENNYALL